MKKLINGFTVPIMEVNFPNTAKLNQGLISLINDLFSNMDDKRLLSHEWDYYILTDNFASTGYSSFNHGNLIEDTKFEHFFEMITPTITEFFSQLEYQGPWKFVNSWANVYPKGAWVPHHNHGTVHWSGAYYVNAPKGCGDIFFIDPKEYALNNEPDNIRWRGRQRMQVPVSNGAMVIFPGYLKHETAPNQTNEDRIIISFNIMCGE